MSATISNKVFSSFGNKLFMKFDMVVGTYATDGVSLTAANLGFSQIDLILCERKNGILYSYDHTNSKILAYRQSIGTTGALSKPNVTVTDGTVLITGGAPTGVNLYIEPDNASGVLTMSGVTGPLTIAATTFGITPITMAVSAAITFTGDSNAVRVFPQVTDAVSLSDTVRCVAIGV
jgi:hypothetical protein